MINLPKLKLGIVAVSRDCFPIELSKMRKNKVVEACNNKKIPIVGLETVVENEKDVLKALDEIKSKEINSLIIFLGNFGPEGPLTMLAQKFNGPVMMCAAAEETKDNLINGRGDAYCGLLSACYNLDLRNVKVYLPEYPVGVSDEIADMINDYLPIARILIAIKKLKIFTFGPRPHDFYACNAPIKPLFDLGVEVMENSELDLYKLFEETKDDPQIQIIAKEIEEELGQGNKFPDLVNKLAQYEVTLMNFYKENLGASEFGIFAIKCWPAFQPTFGCVPCYINSRMAKKGIPISCEVDIYGVLSEYIGTVASEMTATILDINNTVPKDMYEAAKSMVKGYKPTDLFMGFHCGNTATDCMKNFEMKFQLIMHRLMEPESEPNITRGTLEGQIKPGDITIYRLQSSADGKLRAYIAEGEVLDIDPQSFGAIGAFAIDNMGRFYRYALLEKQFPHHTAVAFKHIGKIIFSVFKLLGIDDISVNQPKNKLYPDENPFK
ncbi:MAG: fucose isomerase [archaeon]|nr:fucose isomerase [archaeon]